MGKRLDLTVSRRSLVFAGAAAMTLPMLGARQTSGQDTAVIEGDCEDEPSLQMLFDWRDGKPVYESIADSGPQIDWVPFEHPSLPVPSLIPPDWTGVAGWADSFSRDGVPEWQDAPLALPQLTMSRIVAPDGDAAFEYAVGSIQQVLLTTADSATLAKENVLGADPTLRSVCVIDDQYNQLSPGWFTADRHETSLLATFGNALQLPHDIVPATVVTFTSLYGPRKDMEQLMFDVFLRILFQFLGGGSSDPIPTPTP